MRLEERYARARGSKAFLVGLVAFICFWVTLHFAFGWDHEWGALNTILSSEASIALAFFTMMADKQEAHQRKQLEYMLHLMEAVRDIVSREPPSSSDSSSSSAG